MSQRSRERRNKTEAISEPVKHKLHFNLKTISPLTENQRSVFEHRDQHQLLHGVPGSGKTFLALYHALEDIIENNKYHRIEIIRSCTPSRNLGFLPGNEKEKAAVYEAPYQEICTELFGRGDAYETLKTKKIINFRTTSFIRGITLDHCVVIFDEFQNATAHELNSVLTRLGKHSRVIISGDITQDDLRQNKEKSGAADIMKIVKTMNCFNCVEFGVDDIVRSGFVKNYIIARLKLERNKEIEPL